MKIYFSNVCKKLMECMPSCFYRWDHSFYFAGAFIGLSGIASYLIEFCEKKPKESDSDVSVNKKINLIH